MVVGFSPPMPNPGYAIDSNVECPFTFAFVDAGLYAKRYINSDAVCIVLTYN